MHSSVIRRLEERQRFLVDVLGSVSKRRIRGKVRKSLGREDGDDVCLKDRG